MSLRTPTASPSPTADIFSVLTRSWLPTDPPAPTAAFSETAQVYHSLVSRTPCLLVGPVGMREWDCRDFLCDLTTKICYDERNLEEKHLCQLHNECPGTMECGFSLEGPIEWEREGLEKFCGSRFGTACESDWDCLNPGGFCNEEEKVCALGSPSVLKDFGAAPPQRSCPSGLYTANGCLPSHVGIEEVGSGCNSYCGYAGHGCAIVYCSNNGNSLCDSDGCN